MGSLSIFFFIKEKILQDFKMFFFRNKLNGKSSLSGLQKVFNIITKKFIILLRFSRKKKTPKSNKII